MNPPSWSDPSNERAQLRVISILYTEAMSWSLGFWGALGIGDKPASARLPETSCAEQDAGS
jgi:hypothetical protein